MKGGPFRDTLTPLIEDAQRQLAQLQQRRAALESRYEDTRKRLDAKTQPPPPLSAEEHEAQAMRDMMAVPRAALKGPFIAGMVVGLLTWFQISRHTR